ncbi:hypothetical protein PPL_11071 [Heterostelium album PN500]|uniref:Ankyrin repeat protein n=1 Tax=Heterostelium pallidum (strain ATCC 26659 / Pp 5 / PN500) TaxID=670386 RepID=D3BSV1_HETP5|nr:hypothetical protein PPL_11071 [Heterostelium album PN500]EFA75566.1 hypothetical protein PPL_11071 [Heterostelium album PN500]|eukprot:XP_020427700.1 hypothetical protein PPL_11071 [Heterostelium album PN500]
MEKILFLNIFNNIILRNKIFKLIRWIHKDVKGYVHFHKWSDVLGRPSLMIGNNYFQLFKDHFEMDEMKKKNNSKWYQSIFIPKHKVKASLASDKYFFASYIELSLKVGNFEMFKYLFEKTSMDVKHNNTIMQTAVEYGRIDEVKYLSNIVDDYTIDYNNVMCYSADASNMELFAWVLEKYEAQDKRDEVKNEVLAFHNTLWRSLVRVSQLGRIDMLQLLMERGHFFLTDKWIIKFIVTGALKGGQIDLLKWLISEKIDLHPIDIPNEESQYINLACAHGDLEILKLLESQNIRLGNTDAMDAAAAGGHLDILRYLHDNRSEMSCTVKAMDQAAGNGHLDVVIWLHENRSEGCSTNAMDSCKSLNVLKWLHENRSEGCTTRCMDNASRSKIEIVKWLHENRTEGCSKMAIYNAILNNNFEIVQFLHENKSAKCTSTDFQLFISWDRIKESLELIRYIYHNKITECDPKFIFQHVISKEKDDGFLIYLLDNRTDLFPNHDIRISKFIKFSQGYFNTSYCLF